MCRCHDLCKVPVEQFELTPLHNDSVRSMFAAARTTAPKNPETLQRRVEKGGLASPRLDKLSRAKSDSGSTGPLGTATRIFGVLPCGPASGSQAAWSLRVALRQGRIVGFPWWGRGVRGARRTHGGMPSLRVPESFCGSLLFRRHLRQTSTPPVNTVLQLDTRTSGPMPVDRSAWRRRGLVASILLSTLGQALAVDKNGNSRTSKTLCCDGRKTDFGASALVEALASLLLRGTYRSRTPVLCQRKLSFILIALSPRSTIIFTLSLRSPLSLALPFAPSFPLTH